MFGIFFNTKSAVEYAIQSEKLTEEAYKKTMSLLPKKLRKNSPIVFGDVKNQPLVYVSKNEPKITIIVNTTEKVTKKAIDENFDLLILDEIIASTNLDLIPLEQVVEFLKKKPVGLEVVLTGRNPSQELIELADYVSEIKALKHPYEKGINSRIGIEK